MKEVTHCFSLHLLPSMCRGESHAKCLVTSSYVKKFTVVLEDFYYIGVRRTHYVVSNENILLLNLLTFAIPMSFRISLSYFPSSIKHYSDI